MSAALWIAGLVLLLFGVLEFLVWRAGKDATSAFFNKQLDQQISDRDAAIAAAAKKAKEETDDYYTKRAKFNADMHGDEPKSKG